MAMIGMNRSRSAGASLESSDDDDGTVALLEASSLRERSSLSFRSVSRVDLPPLFLVVLVLVSPTEGVIPHPSSSSSSSFGEEHSDMVLFLGCFVLPVVVDVDFDVVDVNVAILVIAVAAVLVENTTRPKASTDDETNITESTSTEKRRTMVPAILVLWREPPSSSDMIRCCWIGVFPVFYASSMAIYRNRYILYHDVSML